MSERVLLVLFLSSCLLSPCLGDALIFKDGTKKTVRIYKMTADYVSYLYQGRIDVISRGKLDAKAKNKGVIFEGRPLSEKELAALLAKALKKSREEMKKKVREEEKQSGIKPGKDPKVTSLIDAKSPGKGVKVIDKKKSKTHATELKIDPFPDHPVKPKDDPKKAKKNPAKDTSEK